MSRSAIPLSVWVVSSLLAHASPAAPLEEIARVALREGGLRALAGASAVVVAPGGGHLYVAASEPGSVAAVAIDPDTAALSLVDVERDGEDGVDGLGGANALVLAPDGEHLYAVGTRDLAVAVFERDAASGSLDFVGSAAIAAGPPVPSVGHGSVAISPDGAFVYASSGHTSTLRIFARDAASGALAPGAALPITARALAVDPLGTHLYVADTGIAVYTRNAATGGLTFGGAVDDVFFHDYNCCDELSESIEALRISADGAHLYAAARQRYSAGLFTYYTTGTVTTFSRAPATGMLTWLDRESSYFGVSTPVVGLDGVADLALAPDGTRLYAVASEDAALVEFARDPATGLLEPLATIEDRLDAPGLAGARGVAVDPAARVLVASARDDALLAFEPDAQADDALVQTARLEDGGARGLDQVFSVAVSGDGSFVYASGTVEPRRASLLDSLDVKTNQQPPASIAIFARDPATGSLSFVGEQEGLPEEAVLLAPVGDALYALLPSGLRVFSRDEATGALTPLQTLVDGEGGIETIANARFLVVSPDQSQVYVSSFSDGSITQFERDSETGLLAPGPVYGAALGLVAPNALAFGPGAAHLYVGDGPDVVVLARGANGALSLVERLPGASASTIAVRPERAYFARPTSLAVFDRDPTTGALSFNLELPDLLVEGGDLRVRFSRALALPDESTVYFAGGVNDVYDVSQAPGTVQVFAREASTGDLSLVETETGAKLGGAASLALAPGGAHLYAASTFEDELVVFATPELAQAGPAVAALAVLAHRRRVRAIRA